MIQDPRIFDSESILSAIYNGMVVIDAEGTITYFNKTAEI
jgi:sensor histidine kinase regulating citrate/malate metabolism